MTSRTTPVGALVVALASLIALGCSAQTSAVFDALLDPAGAPASDVEAVAPSPEAVDSTAGATLWPHPDGYAMVLPSGWSGIVVDEAQASQLVEALSVTYPALGERIRTVLASTGSRIIAIAIAVDGASDQGSPVLLVLAQPTRDQQAHALKTLVKDQIAALPGLIAGPYRDDATLPSAKGVRFDYSISDPDLGVLQVRSYLFRFGSDAYLVSFVAPEAAFETVEPIFEAIAASLRFGV